MRRELCGGCGRRDLNIFLDLGHTPLADRFPATATEEETWYPLQVAVCPGCWLVQLMDLVPDDVLYGPDYGFFTGASPSAVRYFKDYAADLMRQFSPEGLVVEVACNDGTLLHELTDQGLRTLGVEPAAGPAEKARERGLDVVGESFGIATARQIVAEHGKARLVVANNVAAHVTDLDDFFGGIVALLDLNGAAVVEVQYLADLLAGNQFDHVYHEHRYYFSIATLAQTMERHGLFMQTVSHTPAQGGSIRIAATRVRSLSEYSERAGLRRMDTYTAFQARIGWVRDRLSAEVDDLVLAGRKIAGYGATAKSTTLLNYCRLGPSQIDHIVDRTPHKIGRYAPGTKIPIVGESERPRPDVYLLLAWNYLPAVLRREQAYMIGGGRFLVPIPYPVLL